MSIARHVDSAEGGGPQQSEQEALQQHFVSIQHIPEQKTLPTLMPSLQAALLRAADTAPLKEQLRCAASPPPPPHFLFRWRGILYHNLTALTSVTTG